MSGPEFNPADEEPIDREEWEKFMTTNAKPELCEVCGGTAEKPNYGATWKWHSHESGCDDVNCLTCTAPIHSQADKPEQANHNTSGNLLPALHPADKHKRVAERLLEVGNLYMEAGPQTNEEFERILREEYPE